MSENKSCGDIDCLARAMSSAITPASRLHIKNKQLQATNQQLVEAFEAVVKAEPLWLPHDVDPQYAHEEEALHVLAKKVRKAITNAKKVQS